MIDVMFRKLNAKYVCVCVCVYIKIDAKCSSVDLLNKMAINEKFKYTQDKIYRPPETQEERQRCGCFSIS